MGSYLLQKLACSNRSRCENLQSLMSKGGAPYCNQFGIMPASWLPDHSSCNRPTCDFPEGQIGVAVRMPCVRIRDGNRSHQDASLQAKRGVPVFSGEFEHSAHVEHYRRYPAEYQEEIEAFLAALT